MSSEGVAQASLAAPLAGERGARFYSPQLDGLRFLAALLVFLAHAPTLPFAPLRAVQPYGWLGIDLFLALSGYLIVRLLLIEHERTGRISLKAFYIRRALRIWPLYLGFATVVCGWAWWRGKIPAQVVLAWWISHISFTNDLLTALKGWTPVWWTLQLWTISLEEQAYLVIPLVVLAIVSARPRDRTIVGVAMACLAALLLGRLACFLAGVRSEAIYVLPLRGDGFVLGGLAALLVSRGRIAPRGWMAVIGVLLMACAPLFAPLARPTWYDVFGYSVTAAGATAIVIGSQTRGFERSPLAWAPMRYLGKISYGFYVFHLLAIAVAWEFQKRTQVSDVLTWLLAFALTVAAASASYALYERPFLKLKVRFERVPSRPA